MVQQGLQCRGPNGGKADYDVNSEYDEDELYEQFLDSLTEQERYDYKHNIKPVKVDSPYYSENGGCFTKTPSSSITQQPDGSTLIEEWEDDVYLIQDGGVHFTHELDEIIEFYEKHIRTIVAKLADCNPGKDRSP